MKNLQKSKKWITIIISIVIALLSIFVVADRATDARTYARTIQSIDEKKATVMGVTAAAITASTLIAAIPGDASTPIANEIMDIGSYLLIVVCALVLEKSLLTVLGYLSYNILIPAACAIFIIAILAKKDILKLLSLKIAVFAVVISLIVPFSLRISDLIYEVNQDTITDLVADIEQNEETEQVEEAPEVEEEVEAEEENRSWWKITTDKVKDTTNKVKDTVSNGLSKGIDWAKQKLNDFIDAIAVFIIAYCAIPIIVFFVVIWFVKILFGVKISMPSKDKVGLLNKLKKPAADDEIKALPDNSET